LQTLCEDSFSQKGSLIFIFIAMVMYQLITMDINFPGRQDCIPKDRVPAAQQSMMNGSRSEVIYNFIRSKKPQHDTN